jgi:glycosyltransferase involved in cell wall biosynthesis
MNGVTLAIPMYRSSNFLEELFSRLRQMQPLPAEIILLDDASPDDSLALARAFAAAPPDGTVVRVVANDQNQGIAGAYNRLVTESSQPWIQILDADDYPLELDFYDRIAPELQSGAALVVTAMDASGGLLRIGNTMLGWLVPHRPPAWWPILGSFATRSGVIYRTNELRTSPFIDPAFPGSDVIHFLALRRGTSCNYSRAGHVHYRIHDDATSSQQRDYSKYLDELAGQSWAIRMTHLADLQLRRLGQRWE